MFSKIFGSTPTDEYFQLKSLFKLKAHSTTGKISSWYYGTVCVLVVIVFGLLQPMNVSNVCHEKGELSDWVQKLSIGEIFVQSYWIFSNITKDMFSENSEGTVYGNTFGIFLPPMIVNVLALIATIQSYTGRTQFCKNTFG